MKEVIVKGVGKMVANGVDFGWMQDLTLTLSFEKEPVYAGSSYFPKYEVITEKKIEGTASYAKINYYQLLKVYNLTQQTGIKYAQEVVTVPDVADANGDYPVTLTNTPLTASDSVLYKATELSFIRVSDKSLIASAGEYAIDYSTGTVYFHADDAGKEVVIDYFYNDTAGDTVGLAITETTAPPVFSVYATVKAEDPAFGTDEVMTLYLPRVRTWELKVGGKIKEVLYQELPLTAYPDASGIVAVITMPK